MLWMPTAAIVPTTVEMSVASSAMMSRVAQERQERAVPEQIGVLPEREALEACDVRAGVERGHGQNDHGNVEEDEHQDGDGAVEVLHTLMTSSPSPSPKRFITATQIKIRIINTRLMAAPRFGL